MQETHSTVAQVFAGPPGDPTICVADGYGLTISVDRRHLVVADGIGRQRRTRRYARATHGLRRVVVLGHSGSITLEALRWVADAGIGFVHLDAEGRVLAVSGAGRAGEALLHRAQALAPERPTGIAVSRYLLGLKLRGQLRVLAHLADSAMARDAVRAAIDDLEGGVTMDSLLEAERTAALAYWGAWASCPVNFIRRDRNRVPEHWLSFGQRGSPLTNGPRLAANAANAALNLLYALLATEVHLGCLAMGVDPLLGVAHAIKRNRKSFVYDVMEASRPEVDAYLLALIGDRVFRASDFAETRQGVCRVLPPLTHELAQTMEHWRKAAGPVIEHVVRLLQADDDPSGPVRTRLTEANRSAGRVPYRRTVPNRGWLLRTPSVCRSCGVALTDRRRRYCDTCWAVRAPEIALGWQQAAVDELTVARTGGRDPTKTAAAKAKAAQSLSRRKREELAWNRTHPERPDSEIYRREILPVVQAATLSQLVRATGLSMSYCILLRQGRNVPHPRHWESLQGLGGSRPRVQEPNAPPSNP